MNRGTLIRIVLAGLLGCGAASAQTTEVPQALGTEVPPLETGSEQLAKNVLDLRLRLASVFDDNALGNNLDRHSDQEYDVQPTLDFKQELERLQWSLYYAPGFSYNQHYSQRRYFSQLAGSDFAYLLRKHLQLHLHGQAAVTSNPFDQLDRNASAPQLNLIDRPNTSVILPKYKQIAGQGGIGIDWFESAFTTVNLSGDISDLRYRNLATPTLSSRKLIDTRVVHGHGAILHRFTAKETLGFMYDYQDLGFPKAHSRTVTHSFQAVEQYSFTPNMTVTLFAGPEYSRQHDIVELNFLLFILSFPTFHTMWSPVAGAQYAWQGQHNAFRASYVHKISDGGGLIGAVTLNHGEAEFRSQLTRRWTFTLDGYYGDSDALGAAGTSTLKSYAGNIGFERELTPNLFVDLAYSRLHQKRSGSVAGLTNEDHNRVLFSLEYRWSHPLGR